MAPHAVKIKPMVATRESGSGFFSGTATGRSVTLNRPAHLARGVFTNDTRGLPARDNEAIRKSAGDPATRVFAHDDLHRADDFWYDRVLEGLARFDLVGRAIPRQAERRLADSDRLSACSGAISSG